MDDPDTVIELDRSVVEEKFAERLNDRPPPQPKDFSVPPGITGQAHVTTSVARVWFHTDGSGRRWQRRDGASTADLDRHLAFELRLGEHPPELGLEDSRLAFTGLGPVPLPAVGTRTCNGRTYKTTEIPLFGRLVVHETIERTESMLDGQLFNDLVLDFAAQPGPLLEAGPVLAGSTAQMFGPDVRPQAGGRVQLVGTEPHVVWELTQAEEDCIRQSPVAVLIASPLIGKDPIDLIATALVKGAVATLATSGDEGTSRASLLGDPHPVDPTGASGDPFAIDGIVRAWTRAGSIDEQESFQVQIQTVESQPVPLPASVLALSTDETVGFMRSNWAILRTIRASQIRGLCLSDADFDPNEGCRLMTSPSIKVGDNDADLVAFAAEIVDVPELGHDVIDITGRAENDSWYAHWFIDFEMQFRLDRGDVPRDPLMDELPPDMQPSRTLAEMNRRLRELSEEQCAGGDVDAIEAERDEISKEKLLLPTEVGVKPLIFGEPHRDSDFEWTTAAYVFGIALLAASIWLAGGLAMFVGAKIATSVWIMASVFLAGATGVFAGGAILDGLYYDKKVSDGLRDFIQDKSQQDGEALPLEGYSPTVVLLKDGFLRVFLAPLPEGLKARFYDPDERSPGDLDRISQQIAGLLPDGRMWQLSIPDAAHLVGKGRISIAIDAAVSGTGQPVPLHVARSARGRRYLRTPPDHVGGNDLRDLPRIPAP
jgi:hypothetical protein